MPHRRPPPTPLDHALSHLSKLAAAGINPGRMAREMAATLEQWRVVNADETQEWTTVLREQLAVALKDAMEQAESVDASEGSGAAKHAQAVIEALRAALGAVEG